MSCNLWFWILIFIKISDPPKNNAYIEYYIEQSKNKLWELDIKFA